LSSGVAAPQLNAQHVARLEKIAAAGFTFASFPLYAAAVGVRKGNCAALLNPLPDGSLKFFAEPCYLVDGNLSVRIERAGRGIFIWKKKELEATPERIAELTAFRVALQELLA
jgi:hypothetical protein